MHWLTRHPRAVMAAGFALVFLLVVALADPAVDAQGRSGGSLMDRFRQMSTQAEAQGLAEPFKGITTNGQVQPGLYTVRSTGVSTAAVRTAADAFLAALTPEQRTRTLFPVDDAEW